MWVQLRKGHVVWYLTHLLDELSAFIFRAPQCKPSNYKGKLGTFIDIMKSKAVKALGYKPEGCRFEYR
jgi:hypothetical protein